MTMHHFLQKAKKFEIQTFEKPASARDLKKHNVAFAGLLYKHPKNSDVAVLWAEPHGSQSFYYEFPITDISYIEEVSNVVNLEGDVITITRIWVKKGAVGVRCLPFLVEEFKTMRPVI